jgi:hypothetical protein
MTITFARIELLSRYSLKDSGTTKRWTQQELIDWTNEAQRKAVSYKPDINPAVVSFALVAGSKQSVPAGYLQPLDFYRNMGVSPGTTPGRAITVVKLQDLKSYEPAWNTATASQIVIHAMFDEKNPSSFYVYPPQPAAPSPLDLVTNGTFASDANWTKGTGWAIGTSVATKTAGVASDLSQDILSVISQPYTVQFTVTRTAGTLTPKIGTVAGTAIIASGTYTITLIPAATNAALTFAADASFAGTIDTVSVQTSYGFIEALLSKYPVDVAAGTNLDLSDEWESAVLDYVLYRGFAKDADNSSVYAQRSVFHFNQFVTALNRKDLVIREKSPNAPSDAMVPK